MANEITTYLKYANLQMAAESLFGILSTDLVGKPSTTMTVNTLTNGNNRSSKFTDVGASEFSKLWEVVEHKSDTTTGFSGTLFKATSGGGADVEALRVKYGITAGELTLSFRSTEFADDAARDNQATNAMEIRPFGWAFGQIADMQSWVNSLYASNKITPTQSLSVTGYSLGAHLATAFNLLYPAAATSTYTFNGAGVGDVNAGSLTQVMAAFQQARASGNANLFTKPQTQSLYSSLHTANELS